VVDVLVLGRGPEIRTDLDDVEAARLQIAHRLDLARQALTPNRLREGSQIVKEAAASGRSLREVARDAGVDEAILDEALDYRGMTKPHGG